jgi:hypothetical protein
MKRILKSFNLCLVSLVLCLSVAGCQESSQTNNQSKKYKVPKTMVGVWEAKAVDNEISTAKWAFKIESDGSIRKLNHIVAGRIDMRTGGYEVEGPDPGTFAAFTMGPCETSYSDSNGIFVVRIVLDGFTMKLPQGELSGQSDDYFKGKVSKDGKVWQADWYSYSSLDGGSLPDVNEINANPVPLTFHKLDLKKLAENPGEPNEPDHSDDPNAPVVPHRH